MLNWIQASLARSSAVASVTAPGVPSTTVTFWPVFTRTTPCGVCTATTPSSTMIVVDPSGFTSTANTVPCTEAVAVGVTTWTRLCESVSFVMRL